jgi:hypothetical protein
MRPLKNYGVWTDDYSKHPQSAISTADATKTAGGCHINPEYSGLKTDFFKGLIFIIF